MVVRISEKDAEKWRDRLVDPLLRSNLAPAASDASAPKTSKPHRTPKVARRVSVGGGPEGTGRLHKDDTGRLVGLDIELNLLPVPKERPRVVRMKNGKSVSYTPARTKRFTQDVRAVVDAVMQSHPPLDGPVCLKMLFNMQVPESWPLWKKEAALSGQIAPTNRPDMDNLEKALLDALNEKVFVDDAFVVDRIASKRYAQTPGIFIQVVALSASPLTASRADVQNQSGLMPLFFIS